MNTSDTTTTASAQPENDALKMAMALNDIARGIGDPRKIAMATLSNVGGCKPFDNKPGEYQYSDKEKLAASIIDQLGPVFMNENPKHYIGPDLFKKLTLRLSELL